MKHLAATLITPTLLFLLSAGTACAQTDRTLRVRGPYLEVVRDAAWGSTAVNRNFLFTPKRPDQAMCIFVRNNNPTNAHSFIIAVSQTGDPTQTTFSSGRWVDDSIQGELTPVAADSTNVAYVKTTFAARVAVRISDSVSEAGSPDTADIFIVLTNSDTCGPVFNQGLDLRTIVALDAVSSVNITTPFSPPRGNSGGTIYFRFQEAVLPAGTPTLAVLVSGTDSMSSFQILTISLTSTFTLQEFKIPAVPTGRIFFTYLAGGASASSTYDFVVVWDDSPAHCGPPGTGVIRSFTGTDPAAGSAMIETVPAGEIWRFISMNVTLVTDSNVANRTVHFFFDDGTNPYLRITNDQGQAANLTQIYAVANGVHTGFVNPNIQSLPSPANVFLPAGHRIGEGVDNFQSGDNWSAPKISIEVCPNF